MGLSGAEEEPLGKVHQKFNTEVQEAIAAGTTLEEKEFNKHDNDLVNIKKIDIASHNKNIDYILSVLKSDDMLYVSRAIKQSQWLVDDQYANIINPKFLNEHLFPHMKTKAGIKLLKHIRHYLKNESRVEEFFKNEKKKEVAAKWLSRCPITFIENHINDYVDHISDLEFKRICERSVTIFEVAMKDGNNRSKMKAASFLLNTHADKYLDIFENSHKYSRPSFGPTATKLIMKKASNRIINNFLMYVNYIDIPSFIDNLKKDEIKDFLFELASKEIKEGYEDCYSTVFQFSIIKQFVERMPKEQQFEFVKSVFFDKSIKVIEDHTLQRGTEKFAIKKIHSNVCCYMPVYHWYEFAPFNTALNEIKNLMQVEPKIKEKYSMYKVLLKCAAANTTDLIEFLEFYAKNSLNDDINRRKDFINKVISMPETYTYDENIWKSLTDIVNRMDIYNEDDGKNNVYVQINLLRYILRNKEVTQDMEKNISVSFLQYQRNKLNQDEQNKIFQYLYNFAVKNIEAKNIETETDFTEVVIQVGEILDLLLYWEKELADFSFALEKIKELIKIKNTFSWKSDMSSLYNKKTSWKRLMFEESVILNPSQNVFINALKHDPSLLIRYQFAVEAVCRDNAASLQRLHKKLRVYWCDSLAVTWIKSYFSYLDKIEAHKGLTRVLCTLLSQEPLLGDLKKYAPAQPKIDWHNINEHTLSLQRCYAKNMHVARPQPSAETLLLYAKGDFLQYALQSLLAIFYNMSYVEALEHIPKLLNAPVSLQKHGLRLAFTKLKHEELKNYLRNIWQTSKNISIRAVTFGLLFDLICKEKDVAKAEELWEILEIFMDNLTFKEDKKIYEILQKVNDVPGVIKPKFLVKSYKFLQTLVPHVKIDREKYENGIKRLAYYTRTIMEFMCPNFVANIITEHLDANFCKYGDLEDNMLDVTSSYLLCAKDEETQNVRYERVIVPLIKRAFNQWNDMHDDKYFVRQNFQTLLNRLYRDLEEYIVKNEMIVPTKMFQNILKELETSLPVPQNYIILRFWKLIVKITELIEKTKRENWSQICLDIVPEFGTFCLNTLKDDVKTYFSCIYVLFEKVLRSVNGGLDDFATFMLYEVLLSDKEFIKSYLLVINMLPGENHYYTDNDKFIAKRQEIKKLIQDHSSVEVKIHYCFKYNNHSDISLRT